MALIDIIILIGVAVFVVTRFTKFKLPKDPRDKAARRADWGRLGAEPRRDPAPAAAHPPKPKTVARGAAKDLQGMDKIRALEPAFDEAAFLDGAKAAYRYFYERWNARDRDGLDDLCAPALLARLTARWEDPAEPAQIMVQEVGEARIRGARVHGRTAIVEVEFAAVHREDGHAPRPVASRWTLARPLASDDPNWELEDMTTGMDA